MKRKTSYISLSIPALWLLLAQSCATFMVSDRQALKVFNAAGIALKLQTTVVNGRELHYAVTGRADKPTLFFIHGSLGSWTAFQQYLKDKDLVNEYRMISIDRPGFGQSDFGNAISISEQATYIGQLIADLQNGQPFYLVGHSLGGPLTVKLAAHYKQHISGIVLLAASVDPNEEKRELWRPVFKVFPLCYLLPGAFRPSNIELWAFKKDVLTISSDLNAITCPVVIVQGMVDPLVPPGNAFYAQKELIKAKSVKLITLQDANHYIPWTRFGAIKDALRHL